VVTLVFETEFYFMGLYRFSETCNGGFLLSGMWLWINAEVVFDVPLYSCKICTSNNRFSWLYSRPRGKYLDGQ